MPALGTATGVAVDGTGAAGDARPGVFWHWMNGNISRAGIARDLAAMRAMGLGSAYLFNTGVGIPRGPIDYASDAWRGCVRAACEAAAHNGLELYLHHAAGYAGTGGAWVTPAHAQQRLFWSEARVEAADKAVLARPRSTTEHYEDICVLAYPAVAGEDVRFETATERFELGGSTVARPTLEHPQRLANAGSALTVYMRAPFDARALTLSRRPEMALNPFDGPRDRPPRFTLEASTNGGAFRTVASFTATATTDEVALPSTASFAPTRAATWRLRCDGPSWITGVELHGGARLPDWPIKTNLVVGTVSVPAYDGTAGIDPTRVVDVSHFLGADGQLNWSPPPGRWTAVRIGHGATGSRLAASPDSAHFRCMDMFDPSMVDRHFAEEIDPLLRAMGSVRLTGLLADSFESGRQNWSRDFPAWFAAARGYPLGPWLLAMTGRIVGDAARTEKALFEVRRTQSELMAQSYYGRLRENSASRGLAFAAEPYGNGAFDALGAARASGTALGEFWAHYTYGADAYLQLAVSSAHASGSKVVACEAFTGAPGLSGWSEYPAAMKAPFDRMTTLGLSGLATHVYAHQPHPTAVPGMTMGPFGMHFDNNNGWTPEDAAAWSGYVARVHAALREGDPVVDIACLKNEEPAGRMLDLRQSPYAVPRGYATDMVDATTLKGMRARSGRAVNAAGLAYRCIVLPPLDAATEGLVDALIALAGAGVPIFHQGLPWRHPGAPEGLDADSTVREHVARLAALPSVQRRAPDFAAQLDAAGIKPDHVVEAQPGADINAVHRRIGNHDLYFVANNRRRPERCRVMLRSAGVAVAHDPVDNRRIALLQASNHAGRTMIEFDLPPAGSAMVRISPGRAVPAQASPPTPAAAPPGPVRLLDCWINPDTRMLTGRGFLLVPGGEDALGIAAGRNGIVLYRRQGGSDRVLGRLELAVGGWTHLALAVDDDKITAFRDGEPIGSVMLDRPLRIVPEPMADWQRGRFEFQGEATPWQFGPNGGREGIVSAYRRGLPPPVRAISIASNASGSIALIGPWRLDLQGGRGAPSSLMLETLIPLDRHSDPEVAHFSGIARYTHEFDTRRLLRPTWLFLGRVASMATVTLNGIRYPPTWTAPFALDIGGAVRPGLNRLSVEVSVLPPNRLIGDERLAPEAEYSEYGQIASLPRWYEAGAAKSGERIFFATWRHYTAGDPLFASGLIGPVSLSARK